MATLGGRDAAAESAPETAASDAKDATLDAKADAAESEGGHDARDANPDQPISDARLMCEPTCRIGESCCGTSCVNTNIDPDHCGSCDRSCAGARATETCFQAACIVAKCEPGWADCDLDPKTGCEASLSDDKTCGTCTNDCSVTNGVSVCQSGTCTAVTCNKGFVQMDRTCTACAKPTIALCGRSSGGILCARAQANGTLAAPTLFTTDFRDDDVWALPSHYATIQFPDVNGDGQADVCGRSTNGVFCGLGVQSKSFAPISQWTPLFEDPTWGSATSGYGSLQFPDVNGDGKADLCAQRLSIILCMVSTASGFTDLQGWSTGFEAQSSWDTDTSYWGTLRFPDLNGDARADLCGRMSDGVHCGLSIDAPLFESFQLWSAGSTFFTDAAGWTEPSLFETIQFPDIDGDGRPDLCSRTSSSIVCQRATTAGRFGSAFEAADFGNPKVGQPPDQSVWATIQFPDIDGDGKADLCGRLPAGLACALSTGAGFQPLLTVSTDFSDAKGFSDPLYAGSIQFADLDGDGADDVCGRRKDGVVCALSDHKGGFKPSTFLAAFTETQGWSQPQSASTLQFVDLTRDTRPGCPPPPMPTLRSAARLLR